MEQMGSRPRPQHHPLNTKADPRDLKHLPSAAEIFTDVVSEFQATLTDEDRLKYQAFEHPEALISSIKQNIKDAQSRYQPRLLSACTKINNFVQAVRPFFKVVEVLVSSSPEWAGTAWNAIHSVFLISSHYVKFFERLAEMFSTIAEHLPSYDRHLDLLKRRVKDGEWKLYYERLAQSLSFIYTDILQFCYDCHNLFRSKRMGIQFQAKLIMDVMWSPFDVRFSGLLRRFEEHRKLFEKGLDEVYKKEMLMHYEVVEGEIRKNGQDRKDKLKELTEKETKEIRAKKMRLRVWIAAPDWQRIYNDACKPRGLEAGKWFLKNPKYNEWARSSNESMQQEFLDRVLIVSGKPGYGKTVISCRIIEDLGTKSSGSTDKRIVIFFHFDQQHADLSSGRAAFQSLLTQLVNKYGEERDWVDIASVVMNETGSGQQFASEEDVISILRVYTKRLTSLYFVLDGLDECSDFENFVNDLEELTSGTYSRVILFGRPHLRYANAPQKPSNHLLLMPEENISELRKYLHPKILGLLDTGALPRRAEDNASSIALKLAKNSDSIFLWAVLMVKYLESPFLTPDERLTAITNVRVFTGLDTMFTRILKQIEIRAPKPIWKRIQLIFQCLAVARYPMSIEELHTAIAVKKDSAIQQDDMIKEFDKGLVETTGSLIEIHTNRTVSFIHLSVSEFLAELSGRLPPLSPFLIRTDIAHFSVATICLSYLLNDIPHSPLSDRASNISCSKELEYRFRFLKYAALNWTTHLSEYLQAISIDTFKQPSHMKGFGFLFSQVSRLLFTKNSLSMWIEVSWIMGIPPNLEEPHHYMDIALYELELLPRKDLEAILTKVKALSKDLSKLEQQWGTVLRKSPNEIWLPEIRTWFKSDFLPESKVAKLTSLVSPEDHLTILLASQVSSDGREVGLLKVRPPLKTNSEQLTLNSFDWEIIYQIWSLDTMSQIFIARFNLPSIRLVVEKDQDRGFSLPVAFSHSLERAVVGDMIIQTNHNIKGCPPPDLQMVEISSCYYFPVTNQWPNSGKVSLNQSITMNNDTKNHIHVRDSSGHECYDWYQYCFSPNEEHLLLMEGLGPPNVDVPGGPWILSAYKSHSRENMNRPFKLVALVGISLRRYHTSNWIDGNGLGCISCFHPLQPIVVVAASASTSLWKFTESGHKLEQIYPEPLEHMRFSDCGNYLYGAKNPDGTPVFLNIKPYLPKTNLPKTLIEDQQSLSIISPSQIGGSVEGSLISAKTHTLSSMGMPVFTKHNGQQQFSALRHDNSEGKVTLTTRRADGTTLLEVITKIPKTSTLEQSYSTLVQTGSHKNLRMVLNMAAQETYSLDKPQDFALPAVLDRQRESIPSRSWRNGRKRALTDTVGYQQYIEEYKLATKKRLRDD